jgi:hypothetical protein
MKIEYLFVLGEDDMRSDIPTDSIQGVAAA